ncbi:Rpn family recombination-promoting nuclease/putative transposase [Sporosarcina oncorhynchi]|uniref:Rpn family recombination-promoting nuclease/putative transposase n=1 Tax=Sporosarcina oncorhynchi TaxID=3056444 RepID=A0ABZ0L489_9BACL|nr:Rpn family recombination-promoting nuclease/putative transposase [Sporosarcina sp. T2O-4]WOV86999.1 Rpn family recombination-promoting nuclease/putative transposase [Sporosarcina sp. T2O-4]
MLTSMVAALVMERPVVYQVDQDGLWMKVIRDLFEDFLLFFAPELHAHVDFSKSPDFLQQELFQEVADEKKGRRMADQIVKVKLTDGAEQWILVHIEVQSENEEDFAARMFKYFYRIYDTHEQKIVAFAIMTSLHKNTTSQDFRYDYFGTTLHYAYTISKIITYDKDELRRSEKLFSKIVLAAKLLHETKDEAKRRYVFKRRLMRSIVRNPEYSRTSVQAVFHFIDYLLRLPIDLEKKLANTMYSVLGKEKELMQLYDKDNASPTIVSAFERERIEGKKEERRKIALNLLKNELPIEMIMNVTELSLEEIQELQN